MKYYTPELLARFGSDDLGAAKTARQELERKADEDVSHLGQIRPKMPSRFAELQERYYLHDARVVGPIFPWLHPDHMMRFPVMPWWDFALDVQGRDAGPGRLSSLALMLQL